VADAGNNAIRRITAVAKGWDTTTIANSPPHGEAGNRDGLARQATFNAPNGIVLDTATNIYVADQRNHTIRKLNFSGRTWDVTTIGGQPGTYGTSDGLGTNALFYMPWGVAVDPAGAIYVADTYNHTIRRGVPAITLNIAAYGLRVVLSWPVAPDGFQLEKNASLSGPFLWEPVTNGIVLAGDHYVLTNTISDQAMFFRLKR
jgi:hypothetical protein